MRVVSGSASGWWSVLATMALRQYVDLLIVVCSCFAAIGWVCFVVGFGMENKNPDRTLQTGWGAGEEHFLWYLYAVLAGIGLVLMVVFAITKRRWVLAVTLVTVTLAMMSSGAPLDSTGHFIYQCGRSKTGVGCQEETFDNMALMFGGLIIYALFEAIVVYLATMAPEDTRFSLITPESSLNDYPMA